jgi:hypothetical protein
MSTVMDTDIVDSQKTLFSDVKTFGDRPKAAACPDKHIEMWDGN